MELVIVTSHGTWELLNLLCHGKDVSHRGTRQKGNRCPWGSINWRITMIWKNDVIDVMWWWIRLLYMRKLLIKESLLVKIVRVLCSLIYLFVCLFVYIRVSGNYLNQLIIGCLSLLIRSWLSYMCCRYVAVCCSYMCQFPFSLGSCRSTV